MRELSACFLPVSPMTTLADNSGFRLIRVLAADIKLAHSVFAMPFALLAAFMAWIGGKEDIPVGRGTPQWAPFLQKLVLIVLAMVLARTAAMLANRWLDREIDKRNPRTAGRALPSGGLSSIHVLMGIAFSSGAFLVVCAGFGVLFGNWWPLALGVPVLAWICAYGWLKRFTSLCHLYLGSSLALSPIAAAIAIDPAAVAPWSPGCQASLWLLAGMVLCWVAGFDVIYALQDVDVDRAEGLFSLPSRLGVGRAMLVSRSLHAIAAACLAATLAADARLGVAFGVGVAVVAALLLYEHLTVARWGSTRIALAFFTLNGVISCVLGALGIIDVLLV